MSASRIDLLLDYSARVAEVRTALVTLREPKPPIDAYTDVHAAFQALDRIQAEIDREVGRTTRAGRLFTPTPHHPV